MCRGGLNSSALMDIVKAVPLDRPCVGKSDDSRLVCKKRNTRDQSPAFKVSTV
ncbi:predicted protein [Botrytis cinerea T4]|uniref:Uncharacterized protein n=1 Tax=Botryotinia fuckeliana (strain T4) TaxID=999810 RepID=G2Y8S9_BOTF4|nr:predicted protein [Botrytis cinerea T4]